MRNILGKDSYAGEFRVREKEIVNENRNHRGRNLSVGKLAHKFAHDSERSDD